MALNVILVLIALATAGAWVWERRRRFQADTALAQLRARLDRAQQESRDRQTQDERQRDALFNSMIEGVLLVDPQGKIQMVNQALVRLFGLSQEVRGRSLMEALRLHQLDELVQKARTDGAVVDAELLLPSFHSRCFQVNASALSAPDPGPRSVLVVIHDLTRIKQLEKSQKEFVANVSHELRTPVSLIKGFTETLIHGAKDDPAVAVRFMQKIAHHTDRLTYLIEDLLHLASLESGRVALNTQPVELREVSDRVLEDFRGAACDSQTTLINHISHHLLVSADTDRLHQVLFNLLENAVKYGRPGGQVELHAQPLPTSFVQVSVSDNGPGIPPEAVPRLFERFFRVDRGRSREQGGTGLGLAIVKHIIQAHGGEVGVRTEPGKGATFYFTLPAA